MTERLQNFLKSDNILLNNDTTEFKGCITSWEEKAWNKDYLQEFDHYTHRVKKVQTKSEFESE